METQITQRPDNDYRGNIPVTPTVISTASPSTDSAVAWCAVFAGAVGSAALSLILLFLGTGFGLTLVSPWSNEGISAASFGVSSILGITVISLLASALGGYLAGRLRTRWANTAGDEVFFRDTAHGFLSWSVATLGTAALLTTVIGTIIGGGVKAGTAAVGATALAGTATAVAAQNKKGDEGNMGMKNMPYLLDSLFRKELSANNSADLPVSPNPVNPPTTTPVDGTQTKTTNNTANTTAPDTQKTSTLARTNVPKTNVPKGEVSRIFMNALVTGSLSDEDFKYASKLVAQATGVDQQTAESRVKNTYQTLQTKLQEAKEAAKEAADKAREVSAKTSLWLFISLLSGAFIASLMAVYGGRQRDL